MTLRPAPNDDWLPSDTVTEQIGPRLTLQEINDLNTHPNHALLTAERGADLSQYCGTIPVQIDRAMDQQESTRRDSLPWPAADARTLIVPSGWRNVPSRVKLTTRPAGQVRAVNCQ